MWRYFNLIRSVSNWIDYLLVKFRIGKREPLFFVTRSGIRFEVPRRLLQTFKEIFMDDCYLRNLSAPLPKNPTVLDIGANAGYFSLQALCRYPEARVYSYEPVPANFRLLEKNQSLNPQSSWRCIMEAASAESGELVLAFEGGDDFTTSATLFQGGADHNEQIRVIASSLRDIFSDCGLSRCDLLKMDCEGAEYGIFYKCPSEILARIDRIVMEVHRGPGADEHIGAMEAFLRKNGFVTRQRPVGMLAAWREEILNG